MKRDRKKNYFSHLLKPVTFFLNKKGAHDGVFDTEFGFYSEEHFQEMMAVERKRSERSEKRIILLMIDIHKIFNALPRNEIARKCAQALRHATREIDVRGWYKSNHTIGIIYTEVKAAGKESILQKNQETLLRVFGRELAASISIACIGFPEDCAEIAARNNAITSRFYSPDAAAAASSFVAIVSLAAKRLTDIAGSAALLLLLSPLFIVIGVAIKVFSRGPVFFKQQRLGRGGQPFTFIKFRSMYVNSDSSIHRDYIMSLIKGNRTAEDKKKTIIYKIQKDPRVTPIGRILRKTSLDELPQLFNVFIGNMSLVGPRPAIPYEAENYHLWHRRRIFEVKPGITGFWQVEGRSTTAFDTMVRMDLHYIRNRSLLWDMKLILKTPLAMFKGAY